MGSFSNPALIGSNTALTTPAFDDLFLPVFGGEVLKRFNEYLTASKFIRNKTISSGNRATFPRMGGLGAERHARGQKLLGLDTEQTELDITLDERPLVSHFRLDDIDQAMMHFETRSELSMQSGQALAEAQDSYIIRLLINASRATAAALYGGTNSVFPGGGFTRDGAAKTGDFPASATGAWTTDNAFAILTALDDITVLFDEDRIPYDQRHILVPVKAWHKIKQLAVPKSASDVAGFGVPPLFLESWGSYGPSAPSVSIRDGKQEDFNQAIVYDGWRIWRSNLLPNGQNITTDEPKYRGDFTKTRAIAFQMQAAGMVTLLSVMTETERDVSRQDWLFVTKMLTGGGTLRPECAVELAIA